ncbi:hypothetical protein SAMN02745134_02597 [Clostridium acidisoli DSM 12555]|uniref:Uncharacterized protein n=1 Tax=Clostridium acidisoli DSM 12555 TaxID=1121291 RepID=A0A1W1XPQ9_9CLOT|nr:DUF6762 family protein [Clostridium acidisoli]SMC25842.1 hypothetical protein SAMN02745134_02597 [Clostridium acidisoli DSM 12555]
MNFSSLVLMEKDKENNAFIREIGSYEVTDGAEYITKMYYDGEVVNIFFDTNKDVEEWEYSAIFDLFNYDLFLEKGYKVEDVDDEYNPTWKLTFDFSEDHEIMSNKIKEVCNIISESMDTVFYDINGKQELY